MADTAHRAAIGAVLANPSYAFTFADRLTADDFDPGWMQNIATAIIELHISGAEVNSMAVLNFLRGHGMLRRNDGGIGPFIADLYSEAAGDVDLSIDAVIEATYRRQIWTLTTRIRQGCAEWPLPALLATVDRALTDALQASARLAAPTQPQKSGTGIPGLTSILDSFTHETPAA